MINFRRIFPALGPGWLMSGDGAKVFYSLGVMLDATLEKMRQALHARLPEYAETETSLAYIGRDRLIIRGRNETAASYARRLVEWRYPYGHRVRGNALGMLRQIRAYLGEQVQQFTVDRRGSWFAVSADGTESYALDTGDFHGGDDLAITIWSRFWVGIQALPEWSYPTTLIDDPELWGGVIEESSEYVIGVEGMTQSDVEALRSIAREWKPAGTRSEYLYIGFGDHMNVLSSYISLPTTEWAGFGGDFVAWNNANTVPIDL